MLESPGRPSPPISPTPPPSPTLPSLSLPVAPPALRGDGSPTRSVALVCAPLAEVHPLSRAARAASTSVSSSGGGGTAAAAPRAVPIRGPFTPQGTPASPPRPPRAQPTVRAPTGAQKLPQPEQRPTRLQTLSPSARHPFAGDAVVCRRPPARLPARTPARPPACAEESADRSVGPGMPTAQTGSVGLRQWQRR